ncbi:type II secretion system protein N [uncultured Roseovarius sp.]|uniref:type II secretion system protein N n=1 Tax=uncultured Roseovarius sp. TaxID=293344 RepID=UPI002636C6ED|nr:type II secretion system protein N [uncultured Roseovarius sp.]
MRGAGLLTLIAAVCFGYGAGQVGLMVLARGVDQPAPVQIGAALAAVENATSEPVPDEWPAVFDPYVPDPPKAQAPPKKREKYRLVGLVAGVENGWAILTASDGDSLIRAGDRLIGGETVREIAPDGVWIDRDGEPVLIAFEETADEMLARLVNGGSVQADEAELPSSVFAGRDMRRVLGRAGSVRMVAANGGRGEVFPEILWVREGQIYDLVGLRRGDLVLRVNGYSVSDPETLENAGAILAESDEFAVEILRGGQRRTISVRIMGRG